MAGKDQRRAERRSFLRGLLRGGVVLGLLGIFSTVFAYIFPSKGREGVIAEKTLKLGGRSEIPIGGGKLILFAGEPVWVLHLKRGFVALSAICTHRGCIVDWDKTRGVLSCPCHAGLFDTNGNVLAGPPPRPLSRLRVEIVNGDLYISKL
ncbi:MAG: ubiquinol-cytochrome c reductase iron-sulfur subunit [Candidatus Bipolaricaulia bacterium]